MSAVIDVFCAWECWRGWGVLVAMIRTLSGSSITRSLKNTVAATSNMYVSVLIQDVVFPKRKCDLEVLGHLIHLQPK